MEIVKGLDLKWFWVGYSMGANSRKKATQSPNKINNIGKQGVKTTLTNKQKISYFIGLMVGRGKIVQNFDIVKVIQYQDKNNHKSKGEYLTLQVGSKESEAGATVSLPVYICNNSVDNRGFSGFQVKIKYDPNNLTLTSISHSSLWTSTFNTQHDATSGIVLLQGLRDNVGYEDMVVAWLDFKISADAPSSNMVYVQGPSGTGQGSDIITKINGENYYIMPVNLENGEIKIDAKKESSGEEVYVGPVGSSNDTYGPSTDFTYDFDCDLRWIEGSGSGSGASMWVTIRFGDGTSTQVEIPLQEGSHHYKGKIPIKLPSLNKGPIIIEYEVKPNDEDDVYYWFIKAGALWGFETTIPRDEVGELPILEPHVDCFDYFVLYDGVEIESIAPGPGPTPALSDVEVDEIMQLLDDFTIEKFNELSSEVVDALLIADRLDREAIKVIKKTETEDFLISDGIEIEWCKE